ncbi:hypothetical protein ATO8_06306 [Roseivivax marinus]|uniref:Uncharacterized protein n=1 Tax=Roseivivax marinus TaxID=1379903 RepID=W4HNN8_9RHOB|nr:hypothetical protein [Roseivivax marinus]ETW13620.1 hypothetical protein ATO8_06306 [Roseivivax marinus]
MALRLLRLDRLLPVLLVLGLLWPAGAMANQLSLAALTSGRAAALVSPPEKGGGTVAGGSLFADRAAAGLFAPPPPRDTTGRVRRAPWGGIGPGGSIADRLRHLIARAEAGRDGYDAVQHGARRKPPKPPTRMTLAEIEAWTRATPGQPHAIGRYQFIPATLRRLVREEGLSPATMFTPAVQDRLGDRLLAEAGLAEAMTGRLPRRTFMHNLAKIWAGLPTANDRSHYHGYAGNAATMTWAEYEAEMARILPG